MVSFQLESWGAIAPGIETREAWLEWLSDPVSVPDSLGKFSLKQIPPMQRRRFSELGKCAAGAALPLLSENESIPGIFASRHGDTNLTLSLLQGIGRDEPMSPTGFSLAVHNALSGLLSIARKDISEVTAIAASEGLILQSLLEAVGQLQDRERVLCVIYDVPLPELYRRYCESDPFPYAIAMILRREASESSMPFTIQQMGSAETNRSQTEGFSASETVKFLNLLCGRVTEMNCVLNGLSWRGSGS